MIEECYALIIDLASVETTLEGQSLGIATIFRASFSFLEFLTS